MCQQNICVCFDAVRSAEIETNFSKTGCLVSISSIGVEGTRPFPPESIFVRDFLWWGYETVFYMMEQFDSMGVPAYFSI